VLRSSANLQRLDGDEIQDEERAQIKMCSVGLTLDHIRCFGTYGASSSVGGGGGGSDPSGAPDREGTGGAAVAVATPDDELARIESLEVNYEGLTRLQNLESLIALRQASFAHNDLQSIEGLGTCTALEELSLEDNRLSSLENMQCHTTLKKLDLSHNELSAIHNLEPLTHLTQLSLENNVLSGLAGLAHLSSLMELYIGNNEIVDLQEVDHLKNLPKLIIVDLSGNQLCNTTNYRLYTLFRIRRLKVLDGISVQSDEVAQAREKFSGKLTKDLLVERLGHCAFASVCQLELCGAKLRDLAILDELELVNLKELTLENNQISELVSLMSLKSLSVLRLNQNRIESFASAVQTPGGDEKASNAAELEQMHLPMVEVLHLGYNRVSDIKELELHRFPRLRELHLQANHICQVSGLNSCTELCELDLSKNRIRQVVAGSFVGLAMLRELRMEEAGLRSLVNLVPLKSLHHLHLAFNRINDISELEKLASVGCITDITMCNNPVARRQLYRPTLICQIPSVCWIDGREVSEDERERAEVLLKNERPLKFFLQARGSRPCACVPVVAISVVESLNTNSAPCPVASLFRIFGQYHRAWHRQLLLQWCTRRTNHQPN
jgi:Leucine-rich repeat (LRR) protein